ncbi:T9SS type A sorting domain-containing protein [Mariniflexile jejuense]|uniref:T9SS type A sorting domain-containing protein n=1 Tax=Mariniflexile jejuense TaxID=1173582 RepID=A0ABW3JJQ8_9FLAO
MKQKLLFILTVLVITVTSQAQSKVWDFGNDTTTWPLSSGIGTSEMVVDQLGLIPNATNTNFGAVNASAANFNIFSGETYSAVNRFQMNGGGGVTAPAVPTQRSLYFNVDGNCTVKVYFKTGSNGTMRTLFVTDGTTIFGQATTNMAPNTDLAILNASNTAGATKLYIYGDASNNLYRVEVSGANVTTPALGLDNANSRVSTNIQAVSNRIYVSNVKSVTEINIYSITGALVKTFKTNSDTDFSLKSGLYIATLKTVEGQKTVKLLMK